MFAYVQQIIRAIRDIRGSNTPVLWLRPRRALCVTGLIQRYQKLKNPPQLWARQPITLQSPGWQW